MPEVDATTLALTEVDAADARGAGGRHRDARRRDALHPASVPVAVPVTDASRTSPRTSPGPVDPTSSRRRWLLAALAIAVLLVAGALRLTSTPDDKEPAREPAVTTTTTVAAAAAPPPTEATSETTSTEEAPPAGATSVAEAVRDYYAVLDAGRIDEGFALLSPSYQERTGEGSYRGFWESIAGVEVLEADGADLSATATLRYLRTDGTTSTERVVVRFVRDPATGALLIDDYAIR